jgi:hypothetical protein
VPQAAIEIVDDFRVAFHGPHPVAGRAAAVRALILGWNDFNVAGIARRGKGRRRPPCAIRNNSLRKSLSIAVLAAGAALAARPAGRQRLIHDPPDGTGAPPTLCAAPEAAVDLAGRARAFGRGHRRAHVVVGEHVTGAHNHGMARQPALVRYATNYFSPARRAKEKRATYTYSNVALWSADHGPKAQPFG